MAVGALSTLCVGYDVSYAVVFLSYQDGYIWAVVGAVATWLGQAFICIYILRQCVAVVVVVVVVVSAGKGWIA